MENHTSKLLRVIILIYAINMFLSGVFHMAGPQTVVAQDQAIERVLGGAMLAFAFGAGFAFLEKDWFKVRIAVLMQVVWVLLYTLTLAWGVLTGGLLAKAWSSVIIGAVFFILLLYLYLRERRLKR